MVFWDDVRVLELIVRDCEGRFRVDFVDGLSACCVYSRFPKAPKCDYVSFVTDERGITMYRCGYEGGVL